MRSIPKSIPKMKPHVKAIWVKALRSGKYQQCKGALRKRKEMGDEEQDYFCVLGVLVAEYIRVKRIKESHEIEELFSWGSLPIVVQEWAGFTMGNPILRLVEHHVERAIHLNDSERLSFKRLATLIEKNL